jgi:hypothetical protein
MSGWPRPVQPAATLRQAAVPAPAACLRVMRRRAVPCGPAAAGWPGLPKPAAAPAQPRAVARLAVRQPVAWTARPAAGAQTQLHASRPAPQVMSVAALPAAMWSRRSHGAALPAVAVQARSHAWRQAARVMGVAALPVAMMWSRRARGTALPMAVVWARPHAWRQAAWMRGSAALPAAAVQALSHAQRQAARVTGVAAQPAAVGSRRPLLMCGAALPAAVQLCEMWTTVAAMRCPASPGSWPPAGGLAMAAERWVSSAAIASVLHRAKVLSPPVPMPGLFLMAHAAWLRRATPLCAGRARPPGLLAKALPSVAPGCAVLHSPKVPQLLRPAPRHRCPAAPPPCAAQRADAARVSPPGLRQPARQASLCGCAAWVSPSRRRRCRARQGSCSLRECSRPRTPRGELSRHIARTPAPVEPDRAPSFVDTHSLRSGNSDLDTHNLSSQQALTRNPLHGHPPIQQLRSGHPQSFQPTATHPHHGTGRFMDVTSWTPTDSTVAAFPA